MTEQDKHANPVDHGAVFGGSWWTVGNGAQVRLEPDGERRWIEPTREDLTAMLRAVGVDHEESWQRSAAEAVERRIVEWLRNVAGYVETEGEDPQYHVPSVDPEWVVDPVDTRALANAIERGEHRGLLVEDARPEGSIVTDLPNSLHNQKPNMTAPCAVCGHPYGRHDEMVQRCPKVDASPSHEWPWRETRFAPVVEPEQPIDLSRRGLVRHISGLDDETIDRLGGVEPEHRCCDHCLRDMHGVCIDVSGRGHHGPCDEPGCAAETHAPWASSDSEAGLVEPEQDALSKTIDRLACRDPKCGCNVEPERATPWVAPGEEYELRIESDSPLGVMRQKIVNEDRARVRQVDEASARYKRGWKAGHEQGGIDKLREVRQIIEAAHSVRGMGGHEFIIKSDLLAALDEGANDARS